MTKYGILDTIYNAIALGQGARFSAEFTDDDHIVVAAKDGTEYCIAVEAAGVNG